MKFLQVLSAVAVLALCIVAGLLGVVTQEATVNAFAAEPAAAQQLPEWSIIDLTRAFDRANTDPESLAEFKAKFLNRSVRWRASITPDEDRGVLGLLVSDDESQTTGTVILCAKEPRGKRGSGSQVVIEGVITAIGPEGMVITRCKIETAKLETLDGPPPPLTGQLKPWTPPFPGAKPPPPATDVVEGPPLPGTEPAEKIAPITNYAAFSEAITKAKSDPPAMANLQAEWTGKRITFESTIKRVVPDGDTSHYRISSASGDPIATDAVFPVAGHFDPAMPIGTRPVFIGTVQAIGGLGVLYKDVEVMTLDEALHAVPLTSKNLQPHNIPLKPEKPQ